MATFNLLDLNYGIPERSRKLVEGWGWGPDSTVGEWISADLGGPHIVIAIRTSGRYYLFNMYYIVRYKISASIDGVEWSDVVDDTGSALEFLGNTDGSTIVRNEMPTPIETRYVKLTIISSSTWPELSWAIDGCPIPSN